MTENIPPISIGPNWPKPVIIGSVLSGIGISIAPISAMPGATHRHVVGHELADAAGEIAALGTPMKVRRLWPMAFMV